MPGFESLTYLLDAAEAAAPVDAVCAVTREVGLRLGATSVALLVELTRVPLDDDEARRASADVGVRTDADESARLVPYDGGPMERVVRTQRLAVVPPDADDNEHGWTVLAPVTERGEVIGLLEVRLPRQPDDDATREVGSLAHLLGFVVIANRRHTDLFEWGQRSRPLSLSAEIQQRLLPGPRTCEGGAFTLAGWLEPAAEIAGDTFDYSLARDTLHLSMTDAMGHGVGAALTATLCLAALRGGRRKGSSLTEQAADANAAVIEHAMRCDADDFVTGLIGRVALATGELRFINAGHVSPYLARGGVVRSLNLPVNLPFGMFPWSTFTEAVIPLEPGDRVVLVTDGMLERGAEAVDLPAAIRETASLHPREAVAAMADSVLAATGHALSDDATTLCLDWHGGHGDARRAAAGADVVGASGPTR